MANIYCHDIRRIHHVLRILLLPSPSPRYVVFDVHLNIADSDGL